MEHSFSIVKKLQNVLNAVGSSLPKIVFLGSQNSGKRSVIENLVGHSFSSCESGIVLMESNVLTDHQPEDNKDSILKSIENPNSIIVVVIAANTDLATSKSLKWAKAVDPGGRRTLTVVTKLDLIAAETDVKDILYGRVIPFNQGIVGVVNRSQQDNIDGKTISDPLEYEADYFQRKYPLLATRNGTPYLAKALNRLFMHHIRNCLSDIKSDVDVMFSQMESVLNSIDGDRATTKFLDLPDECLNHVFDYCDTRTIVSVSKVCKRIKALAEGHFPKQTKFIYTADGEDEHYTPKEEISEILNHVGPHLVELEIRWPEDDWDDRCIKLFELVGRTIGNRIRKLRISSCVKLDGFFLAEAICPVLQHLEEFNLYGDDIEGDDIEGDFEIRSHCPNLRRLYLKAAPFDKNTGQWPRLEEVHIEDIYRFSTEGFRNFVQNNRQLRILHIDSYHSHCDFEGQLHDIAQNLTNLEELYLDQYTYDLSPQTILALEPLTHLQKLILQFHRDEISDFDDIVANVQRLNGLVYLQIGYPWFATRFEPNPQNIIGIAQNLRHLQVFAIEKCKIENDTILEFIRFADNLRKMRIQLCTDSSSDLSEFKQLSKNTIEAIVSARKVKPNRINPLVLYIGNQKDNEVLEMIQQPNISAFLEIDL